MSAATYSGMRLVQRHGLGVMTGSVVLWLSQTPRLSSVQHQTARGEMTDDGENAELRTAEAGGGAGQGRGQVAAPHLEISCAACAAVCHWSWSRRGRCSELESRYKIRSRGRGASHQLLPVFVLNPAPATPLCPATVYGPLVLSLSSCGVLQNTFFDWRFG